jgi:uncharacterized protein (DUF1778 family)
VLNVLPETLKKQLPCTAEYRTNSILDEKEHAMPQKPAHTSRIEARIAPDALKVVKRAAEIQGRSVSDFVVAAAQEVATRTIEDAYSFAFRSRISAHSWKPSLIRRCRRSVY